MYADVQICAGREGKFFLTRENRSVGWDTVFLPFLSCVMEGGNNLSLGVRCLPANKIVKVQAQMKINRAVQMRAALAALARFNSSLGSKEGRAKSREIFPRLNHGYQRRDLRTLLRACKKLHYNRS